MTTSKNRKQQVERLSKIRGLQGARLSECLDIRKMIPADLIKEYKEEFKVVIPSSHLSMIRKGDRSLPYDYAIAFSKYLDVDAGYLLGSDDFSSENYREYEERMNAEQSIPEHKKMWDAYSYYIKPVGARIINTLISDDSSDEGYITIAFGVERADISFSDMDEFHADVESYIKKALAHMLQKHKYDKMGIQE